MVSASPPAAVPSTLAEARIERSGWGLGRWLSLHRPEVTLVLLSIGIAEILTGSTPVLSLLDPLTDLGLLGFYGAGVLLVRDLSIRWRKGWSGVLLLGMAYGVAEEGIATKTLVDPASSGAGFLALYGRAMGVNWDFAAVIILFHALFSIALPILLVELRFPATRGRTFLTDRGLRWDAAVLGVTVLFGYLAFDPRYYEGPGVLGFLLLLIALFVTSAWLVDPRWLTPTTGTPSRSPGEFLVLGGTFAIGWLFLYIGVPHLTSLAGVTFLGELALAGLSLALAVRWIGREGNERQKVFLALGLLSWYLFWVVVIVFALADFLVPVALALLLWFLYDLVERYPARAPALPVPLPREAPPSGLS